MVGKGNEDPTGVGTYGQQLGRPFNLGRIDHRRCISRACHSCGRRIVGVDIPAVGMWLMGGRSPAVDG
jgi:hypothetical protein